MSTAQSGRVARALRRTAKIGAISLVSLSALLVTIAALQGKQIPTPTAAPAPVAEAAPVPVAPETKPSVVAAAEVKPVDAPAGPSELARAVAAIKLKPSWLRIEIQKEEKTNFGFELQYKPPAVVGIVGYDAAAADTREIASAVLAELLKEGRNPHKESIWLSVWAKQVGFKGETGADLVRLFGSTRYDYDADRLEWKMYKARS